MFYSVQWLFKHSSCYILEGFFFYLTKYQEISNGVDQLFHCSLLQTKVLANDLNCTDCISMNILLEELFHLGVNSFTFRTKGRITTIPSYTKCKEKSPCEEKNHSQLFSTCYVKYCSRHFTRSIYFTTIWSVSQGRYYYHYIKDEETEAQRS